VFFNEVADAQAYQTSYKPQLEKIKAEYNTHQLTVTEYSTKFIEAERADDAANAALHKQQLQQANAKAQTSRKAYLEVMKKAVPGKDKDADYVFLHFVVDYLPAGLVGLLIAIIFLAAWGSIAAALNSLASCTMIDFYLRFKKDHPHPEKNDAAELKKYHLSKWYTLAWGLFCIVVAQFASQLGNSLIEAVNILGSLFYGVILGIFIVAFYVKKVKGTAIFIAAIIGELIVITLFVLDHYGIFGFGFLWLNVVGCIAVVLLAILMQSFYKQKSLTASEA
jgi:Na+/proline symporter